ncbi:MAG TPA: serine/threonine-protein kinase [Solirubrobacteraceae bacterium]
MATTTSMPEPGKVLGGFRVDDVIGVGGMAVVYRAEQLSLGRLVALKVLAPHLTRDEIFRERFRREGKHAAALEHPNIIPVYDSGEVDGLLFIAMRLVDGQTLAEILQSQKLTASRMMKILGPISSALDTAHSAGLVHRDVKPQNILITKSSHPYLADFGIAKSSQTHGLTDTGMFVGSVHYASPEQIEGKPLTPASDLYSLTAVFYQCLTGQVPFPRDSDVAVMHAHLSQPPPSLSGPAGEMGELDAVIARGMAKNPEARHRHCDELLRDVTAGLSRASARQVPTIRTPSANTGGADPAAPPAQATPAAPPAQETQARSRAEVTATQPARDREPSPVDQTERVVPVPPAATRPSTEPPKTDRTRESTPPKPDAPAAPRRWTLGLGLGAAAVLAAALVLLLAAGSGRSRAATLRSGNLVLTVDSHWRGVNPVQPWLALKSPVATAAGGVQVYAGIIDAPGPVAAEIPRTPRTLQARYGAPEPVSQVIALPLGRARRYLWPKPAGQPPLALVILTTGAGEVAIACSTSSGVAFKLVLAACMQVTERARILGTPVEYPGPDPDVASRLSSALRPLEAIQPTTLSALAASRLTARAEAIKKLALARTTAANAVGAIATSPRYAAAIAQFSAALRSEAAVAESIAAAARQGRRGTYASLASRFPSARARVERSSQQLTRVGFALPSIARVYIAALPHVAGAKRAAPVTETSTPPPPPTTTQSAPAPAPKPRPVVTPRPKPKSHIETIETEGR